MDKQNRHGEPTFANTYVAWRWCDHRAASITTLMLGQILRLALVRSPSCLYLIHGARDTHRAAFFEHARVRRT